MISSRTLKTFVKMHEYKLSAKVNALQANRLRNRLFQKGNVSELSEDQLDDLNDRNLEKYHLLDERHRPKSHYFNFIVNAGHH